MNLRAITWVLSVGALAAGCHAALSLDDFELVDDTTTAGGTGGTGGTAAGGGGEGGSVTTCVPSECTGEDTDCQTPICNAQDQCDIELEDMGISCVGPGDESWVCDGEGNCVECNVKDDCDGDDRCDNHVCVPPHCFNSVKDEDESDVNCGGADCEPCRNGQECNTSNDCLSHRCDQTETPPICKNCGFDNDCTADEWCDPDDNAGTCKPDKANGAPCDGPEECINDHCFIRTTTPGVCCNDACDGPCKTCEAAFGASADGQCGNVDPAAANPDPYDECPDQADCRTDVCVDSGHCGYLVGDEPCGSSISCNGIQITAGRCKSGGVCTVETWDCPGGYLCDPTVGCLTSCADDNDCWGVTHHCHLGSCVPDRVQGDRCTRGAQCRFPFHCVDGHCCNDFCTGTCESCDGRTNGGDDGVCSPVTYNTDPYGECTGDFCCTDQMPICNAGGGGTTCPNLDCSDPLPGTVTDCSGSPPCTTCEMSAGRAKCTIDCYNDPSLCSGQQIVCPEGYDCTVLCGDVGGSTACQGKTIVCPPYGLRCTVDCSTGNQSCQGTQVVCSLDGPCWLTCGSGQECLGAEQFCGTHYCQATCLTGGVGPAQADCVGSCDCRLSGC